MDGNLEEIFSEGEWLVLAAGCCQEFEGSHIETVQWRIAWRGSASLLYEGRASADRILREMNYLRGIQRPAPNPSEEVQLACRIVSAMNAFWTDAGFGQARAKKLALLRKDAMAAVQAAAVQALRLGIEAREVHSAIDECLVQEVHDE